MSAADKLYQEYLDKLKSLQTTCEHKEVSEWQDEDAGMMHLTGFQVQHCKECDAEVHRRTSCFKCDKTIVDSEIKKGAGTEELPYGMSYCLECFEKYGGTKLKKK